MSRLLLTVALTFCLVGNVEAGSGLFGLKAWHQVGEYSNVLVKTKLARGPKYTTLEEIEEYKPQSGDVICCIWTKQCNGLFFAVTTGKNISHVVVVTCSPEGQYHALTADTDGVKVVDLATYMEGYTKEGYGRLFVRRLNKPLAEDTERALWSFSKEQEGKPYAPLSELLSVPFTRPIRPLTDGARELLGQGEEMKELDQSSWFCSQLSGAALKVAEVFGPQVVCKSLSPGNFLDCKGTHSEPIEWFAKKPIYRWE